MRSLLVGLLLALLGATAAAAQEERALWVTRYDYRSAEDVRRIFADAARIGVTRVLFQVRGNASVCYPSELEPWREDLGPEGPGFDPLGLAVEQAQRWELRIEAWINVMPLWKGTGEPQSARHPYRRHPEWVVVGSDGKAQRKSRHYVCANPARPDVRAHVAALAAEIAGAYAVDGVHLDYVRYVLDLERKLDFSRDPVSLEAFGKDPDAEPAAWARFKAEQVTQTVREIRRAVRRADARARLTAAVFPTRESRARVHQDVEAWVEEGLVDALYPMTYADDEAEFARRLRESVPLGAAGGARRRVPVIPGVAVYRHDDPRQTLRQIEAVRQQESEGFALFCYASCFRSADQTELVTPDARLRRARVAALARLAPEGRLAQLERLAGRHRDPQQLLAHAPAALASVGSRGLPLLRARYPAQAQAGAFAELEGALARGPELRRLLEREGAASDPARQSALQRALRQLQRDPEGVVPALLERLRAGPASQRGALTRALIRYAPRSAPARAALADLGGDALLQAVAEEAGVALLPELLERLQPGAGPAAVGAARVLARCADAPALWALRRAILRAHPEPEIRLALIEGAGPSLADLELARLAIADPSPAVRASGLRGLRGLVRLPAPGAPGRAAAARWLADEALQQEVLERCEDPAPAVARVARRWRARLAALRPAPLARADLEASLAEVRSGSAAARQAALERLSGAGPAARAAGLELERLARAEGSPELRLRLLRCLGRLGDPERAPYLASVLASPEAELRLRLQAGESLGRLAEVGAPGAVAALSSALETRSPLLGAVLCDALLGVAPEAERALPALRRGLREARPWRDHALTLLAAMGPAAAPALPELRAALRAASPRVARLALAALAQLGPSAAPARPEVAALLERDPPDPRLRPACLDALAAIPSAESWRRSQAALSRLEEACGQ